MWLGLVQPVYHTLTVPTGSVQEATQFRADTGGYDGVQPDCWTVSIHFISVTHAAAGPTTWPQISRRKCMDGRILSCGVSKVTVTCDCCKMYMVELLLILLFVLIYLKDSADHLKL